MTSKIFVDSDVVISSIISSSGAASLLLNKLTNLEFYISNLSLKELEIVIERLNLDKVSLSELLKRTLKLVDIGDAIDEIKEKYSKYVLDINDAHILAGAKKADARFLITYNTKHYKIESINQNLNIIILTPGMFLQYLRSI